MSTCVACITPFDHWDTFNEVTHQNVPRNRTGVVAEILCIAGSMSGEWCISVDQGMSSKITRHHLTVYQTRSSLNICRQMALFEMVHTLLLRLANREKWINWLNLSTPIFRTLQYI